MIGVSSLCHIVQLTSPELINTLAVQSGRAWGKKDFVSVFLRPVGLKFSFQKLFQSHFFNVSGLNFG